jgi:prevent-host-death family protein
MARTPTPIETVKASEARQHFSELVNRVHETGGRVVIEKNGVVVGGLVSREDLRRLRYLDEKTAAANEAIDRFQAAFAGIPQEELERELEKAIAEVRAERRATKNEVSSAAAH